MPERKLAQRGWAFREFVLDLDRGALLRDGVDVPLRPKSLAVLGHLVERHGRLVTKDELLDAVWGHTVVTEGALTQVVIDLRRVLGDSQRRMIRTLRRRGYRFDCPVEALPETDVDGDAHDTPPAAPGAPPADGAPATSALRLSRFPRGSGLAVGLMLAACGLWWGAADRGVADREPVAAAAADRSIAVLPFIDLSPDGDQQYFSEGLAEELLNLLAQVPGLRVIARTSSFSFKERNADIATIARELNVRHVLEGSVRKWGDRVRITAQLVEAGTSAHLWSATYDRNVNDLFAVQDEIALAVVESLKLRLAGEPPAMPARTRSAEAFEHHLQGRFFLGRRSGGDVARAREHFQRSVAADPDFAQAWAGLAGTWYVGEDEEGGPPFEEFLPHWREAVERALAAGPDLAEAHFRAAQYHGVLGDLKAKRMHLARALALAPEHPLMLAVAAIEAALDGRLEDAVALQARAATGEPLSAANRRNYGALLAGVGRLEEAKAQFRHGIALSHGMQAAFETEIALLLACEGRHAEALAALERWATGEERDLGLALTLHPLGRTAEAGEALRRLVDAPGTRPAVRAAEVYAQWGDHDEAFGWLAVAGERIDAEPRYDARRWNIVEVQISPMLMPLRGDARWAAWREERRAVR